MKTQIAGAPALLLAALLLLLHLSPARSTAPVHTVHLVFSHHLDVGLDLPNKVTAGCVGFATSIIQKYFDTYIPRAMNVSEAIRASGSANSDIALRYTVHPWIANLYVDCVGWSVADGCAEPGLASITCPTPPDSPSQRYFTGGRASAQSI